MDYLKAFGVEPESKNEDDWTEEDDAEVERIIGEIEAGAGEDEFEDKRADGEDSNDAESS